VLEMLWFIAPYNFIMYDSEEYMHIDGRFKDL
jgi:hypothetical protein